MLDDSNGSDENPIKLDDPLEAFQDFREMLFTCVYLTPPDCRLYHAKSLITQASQILLELKPSDDQRSQEIAEPTCSREQIRDQRVRATPRHAYRASDQVRNTRNTTQSEPFGI